jgi:hypothetical protein
MVYGTLRCSAAGLSDRRYGTHSSHRQVGSYCVAAETTAWVARGQRLLEIIREIDRIAEILSDIVEPGRQFVILWTLTLSDNPMKLMVSD